MLIYFIVPLLGGEAIIFGVPHLFKKALSAFAALGKNGYGVFFEKVWDAKDNCP